MSEGKVPQTFGEKLVFGIPAIVVALVLSVGIAYAIVASIDGETRKQLEAAKTELTDKTNKLAEQAKKLEELQVAADSKIKSLEEKSVRLAEAAETIKKELGSVAKSTETIALNLTDFKKGQETLDSRQNSDIATTNEKVGKVEQRVQYIEEKIKKIDELSSDVAGLKVDTADLKSEGKKLRSDLEAVRTKADVTEKDLADLGERTRLFQLRVLAARAREAADAARQLDLKNLLNRLDDVEDKK